MDRADLLNVALFGCTAREWRKANPNKKGNIRDYATIQQLLVPANMESYNAILITQGLAQPLRMQALRDMSLSQLQTLTTLGMGKLPQLPPADQGQYSE